MAKHGSDKSPLLENSNRRPHDYTPLYDEWFSGLRNEIVNVLEVGVFEGASLSGWSEYFRGGAVVGLDIKPRPGYFGRGITYQVDQRSSDEIREFFRVWAYTEFEIIIDDGLHNPTGAIPFFTEAFPYLKDDGYYIIEDVRPQYLDQTVYAMEHAHPTAEIEVHDLRYEGSKYDNILIVARKPGNS